MSSFVSLVVLLGSASVASHHKITVEFRFGDSTVDSGNNNYIGTLFISNPPLHSPDLPGYRPLGDSQTEGL